MSSVAHVEFLLRVMDEACQEWQEKFQTSNEELLQSMQQVFGVCTQYFIELSKSTADDQRAIEDSEGVERLVLKMKHLKTSLGNLWPAGLTCLIRDDFNVGSYHVEVFEFSHPVPFYPNNPFLVKFYEWSVYDANGTRVCSYFLETNRLMKEVTYYVLGKAFSNRHCQLHLYWSTIPNYSRMKAGVINDLNGQNSEPLVMLSFGA